MAVAAELADVGDECDGGGGDEQLFGRRVFRHHFPHRDLLFTCPHLAFAPASAYHITRQCGPVPFLDVVLYLDFVDVAIVIERRGEAGKNSL